MVMVVAGSTVRVWRSHDQGAAEGASYSRAHLFRTSANIMELGRSALQSACGNAESPLGIEQGVDAHRTFVRALAPEVVLVAPTCLSLLSSPQLCEVIVKISDVSHTFFQSLTHVYFSGLAKDTYQFASIAGRHPLIGASRLLDQTIGFLFFGDD